MVVSLLLLLTLPVHSHSYCPAVPALPPMQLKGTKETSQARQKHLEIYLIFTQLSLKPLLQLLLHELGCTMFLNRTAPEVQQLCTILQRKFLSSVGQAFSTEARQHLPVKSSAFSSLPLNRKNCSPPPQLWEQTTTKLVRILSSCLKANWSSHPTSSIMAGNGAEARVSVSQPSNA